LIHSVFFPAAALKGPEPSKICDPSDAWMAVGGIAELGAGEELRAMFHTTTKAIKPTTHIQDLTPTYSDIDTPFLGTSDSE
jgi:hypothetical protein